MGAPLALSRQGGLDRGDGLGWRHDPGLGLVLVAALHFDAAVGEPLRAYYDAHREADEVGVFEVDAGALLAVVNYNIDAFRLEA